MNLCPILSVYLKEDEKEKKLNVTIKVSKTYGLK